MSVRPREAIEASSRFSLRQVVGQAPPVASRTVPRAAPGIVFRVGGATRAPATQPAVVPALGAKLTLGKPFPGDARSAKAPDSMRLCAYIDELKLRLERTERKLATSEAAVGRGSAALSNERRNAQLRLDALQTELTAARAVEVKLRSELGNRQVKTVLETSAFNSSVASALAEEERTEALSGLNSKVSELTLAKNELETEIAEIKTQQTEDEAEHCRVRDLAETEISTLKAALALAESTNAEAETADNGAVFSMDSEKGLEEGAEVGAAVAAPSTAREGTLIDFADAPPATGCCDYGDDCGADVVAEAEPEEPEQRELVFGVRPPSKPIGECTGSRAAQIAKMRTPYARPLSSEVGAAVELGSARMPGKYVPLAEDVAMKLFSTAVLEDVKNLLAASVEEAAKFVSVAA